MTSLLYSGRRIVARRCWPGRHQLRIQLLHRQLGLAVHGKKSPVAFGSASLPGLVKRLKEKCCNVVGLRPRVQFLVVRLGLDFVAAPRTVLIAARVTAPASLADDDRLA